ncbi:hypothetical protein ACQ4PT_044501 [Festuca glaucescens]
MEMEMEMATPYEPKKNSEIRIFESTDDMATDLAEYISQVSEISVKERGYFAIALSGGYLVNLMRKLCEAPYSKTLDWSKWYVFWADERAVAKTHVESNYKLTKEGFLSKEHQFLYQLHQLLWGLVWSSCTSNSAHP